MENETSNSQNKTSNFFSLGSIRIAVCYPELGLIEPIVFDLRPMLSTEWKLRNQNFYAQSEAEQNAGENLHNIEMLAALAVDEPQNLPGFEMKESGSLESQLLGFFGDGNELKQKVAGDILNLYFRKTKPVSPLSTF